MLPARDIGGAIRPLTITDGQVNKLEIQLGRAEEQIEIAEWIEVAEVGTVRSDQLIILAP